MTYFFAGLFLATVPLANWMIGNVGTCVPNGPCLVPVGFGLMAPSGVLAIGAALVLRDAVHEQWGPRAAALLIVAGASLSVLVAPIGLVIASATAFLLSELADLAVYEPLRRSSLWVAVAVSGAAGALVDSAVFLIIAFGSLDYLAGQFVGKAWATLAAAIFIYARRRYA